jgi:glucose-6-phosphate dehydrogenase assembly protein OpcA
VTLGRVLTLIVDTDEDGAEAAIGAANDASNEHPCRVLVVVRGKVRGKGRGRSRHTAALDAEIRVGGDAGASEVVILRLHGAMSGHPASVVLPLLLPDAPVVTWWPQDAPDVPAEDPLGALAQRRITDSATARRPVAALDRRAAGYRPGDTDLAWTRLTMWRGLLAAALDQPPFERITQATVSGMGDSPSTQLLAAWLRRCLRTEVVRERTDGPGITGVVLERRSGPVVLSRPDGRVASLTQPGQPERRVALARRPLKDCLAEELRRLDPDDVYGETLTRGLALLANTGKKSAGRTSARKTTARKATTGTSAARSSASDTPPSARPAS